MYKLSNLLLIEDSLDESTISKEDYKVIQNLCLEQLKTIESKDEKYICLYNNKVLLILLHFSKLKDVEVNTDEFVAIINIATEEDKKMNSNVFILVE